MKLLKTIKDTFFSSLPLSLIVVVCLLFFPLSSPKLYGQIIIGYISVVAGLALFLVGLDSSILPIGHMIGSSFSKYSKLIFILSFGFLFGLLATVAEPALAVLARQITIIIPIVENTIFIWITGAGIGICVAIALIRIIKNINIKLIFAILYTVVFILVIFSPPEFISLAFDGSGATTGDISVPFILALGIGISAIFSKNKTNEDSFGIIGIASVGPIIAVLVYGIILKAVFGSNFPTSNYIIDTNNTYIDVLLNNFIDVALAILPIVIFSAPLLIFVLKLPKREFLRLILGVLPVYIGLLIFLSGIDYGFAFIGQHIGQAFFKSNMPDYFPYLLLIVGFMLGAAITVSEPAVIVLGSQIEDLTNGHIKKITITITLALGIGVASLLSILKILTQINILYFLVPLYAISLIMMKFTPKLFVGLAFDSGGVTGGALSSAFLTPLTLSIAQSVAQNTGNTLSILTNGFGIISFISVTPIIAIQTLGIIYDISSKKATKTQNSDDNFESLKNYVNYNNEKIDNNKKKFRRKSWKTKR